MGGPDANSNSSQLSDRFIRSALSIPWVLILKDMRNIEDDQ